MYKSILFFIIILCCYCEPTELAIEKNIILTLPIVYSLVPSRSILLPALLCPPPVRLAAADIPGSGRPKRWHGRPLWKGSHVHRCKFFSLTLLNIHQPSAIPVRQLSPEPRLRWLMLFLTSCFMSVTCSAWWREGWIRGKQLRQKRPLPVLPDFPSSPSFAKHVFQCNALKKRQFGIRVCFVLYVWASRGGGRGLVRNLWQR